MGVLEKQATILACEFSHRGFDTSKEVHVLSQVSFSTAHCQGVMYAHLSAVRQRVDFLYKRAHSYGLIEQTRVAVFFQEHTTTPHSDKLKNLE